MRKYNKNNLFPKHKMPLFRSVKILFGIGMIWLKNQFKLHGILSVIAPASIVICLLIFFQYPLSKPVDTPNDIYSSSEIVSEIDLKQQDSSSLKRVFSPQSLNTQNLDESFTQESAIPSQEMLSSFYEPSNSSYLKFKQIKHYHKQKKWRYLFLKSKFKKIKDILK